MAQADGASAEGYHPSWDDAYVGTPPWDIGRPQASFVALAGGGALRGSVLDLGCGTGEHALLAASRGASASGIDISPRAIAIARTKAEERGLDVAFEVGDALAVASLGATFDAVLDCGFFHTLSDDDRVRAVAVLREVLRRGGSYHLLCFSERVPGSDGPRRIRQDEIRASFADGFEVASIDDAMIEVEPSFGIAPVHAWLARIVRR